MSQASSSQTNYARFVQDKELDIRNFKKQVISYHNGYSIPNDLLKTEKRRRLHLLHTISTVHMMEQYVQKVKLVSETEKENAKLCPLAGEGLTKRMLPNIKVDSFSWMEAKLEVRKSLLPNLQNSHVRELLESTLWDPDIFPDEAMAKMKLANPGKKLENLLGIRGVIPV